MFEYSFIAIISVVALCVVMTPMVYISSRNEQKQEHHDEWFWSGIVLQEEHNGILASIKIDASNRVQQAFSFHSYKLIPDTMS